MFGAPPGSKRSTGGRQRPRAAAGRLPAGGRGHVRRSALDLMNAAGRSPGRRSPSARGDNRGRRGRARPPPAPPMPATLSINAARAATALEVTVDVLRPRRAAAPSRARASSERHHHQRRACPSWTRSSRSSRTPPTRPSRSKRRSAASASEPASTMRRRRGRTTALFSCWGGNRRRVPRALRRARPSQIHGRAGGAVVSAALEGNRAPSFDAAPYGRALAAGGCGSTRTGRA